MVKQRRKRQHVSKETFAFGVHETAAIKNGILETSGVLTRFYLQIFTKELCIATGC